MLGACYIVQMPQHMLHLCLFLFCVFFKGERDNHSYRLSHIQLCLIVVFGPNLGGCYIVQFLAAYAEFVLVFVFVS